MARSRRGVKRKQANAQRVDEVSDAQPVNEVIDVDDGGGGADEYKPSDVDSSDEDSGEDSGEDSAAEEDKYVEVVDANNAAPKHDVNAQAPPGFAQIRQDSSESDRGDDSDYKQPEKHDFWNEEGEGRKSSRKRTAITRFVAGQASGRLLGAKRLKKSGQNNKSTGASGASGAAGACSTAGATASAVSSAGASSKPLSKATLKAPVSPSVRAIQLVSSAKKGVSTKGTSKTKTAKKTSMKAQAKPKTPKHKAVATKSAAKCANIKLVTTPAAGRTDVQLVEAADLPVNLPSFQDKFSELWKHGSNLQTALLPKQIFEAAKASLVCMHDMEFFMDHCEQTSHTILGLIDRCRRKARLGEFSVDYTDTITNTVRLKAAIYFINKFGMMQCVYAYNRNCDDVINQFMGQSEFRALDLSLTVGQAFKSAYDATKTKGFYMAIRNTLSRFTDSEPFVQVVRSFHINPRNNLTKAFLVKCAHVLLCVQAEQVQQKDINKILTK